jgi:hypothetical protein
MNMATASVALDQWNAEYYETMAAALRARLAVQSGANHLFLAAKFRTIAKDFNALINLLSEFEARPSEILLDEQAREIPQRLRILFRKTCDVLEAAEQRKLTQTWLMRDAIDRINNLNQQLAGFADRFEAAQQKLRTFVPKEQVQGYFESLRAYKECELASDVATEDDVKRNDVALHF